MDREQQVKANFIKAVWEARVGLLWSLRGVAFQEPGHNGWLSVVGVTEDGALVESADNPGDSTLVPRDRCEALVKSIVMTGLGRANADGWERKGDGGGFIYNWPGIVMRTGWSYEDIRGRGVSFCTANPKKSGEESWAV